MRRLALTLLLLSGPAWAQPQEISSEGLIKLSVGQSKAFEFAEPFREIYFAPEDIVKSVPQSDRQFTIAPIAAGSTRMFVRSPNGQLMYNVDIVVSPEPGHLVKLYGGNRNDDLNAGYVAVYCTDVGCERPDKDLPKPTAFSVERVTGIQKGQ
jgi:hypothetical protein